jgi:hypothetical protein
MSVIVNATMPDKHYAINVLFFISKTMNSQVAKDIRKYVKLKMKDEGLPDSEEKRLVKIFKGVYEKADEQKKTKYRNDMRLRFEHEKKLN